MTPAGRSRRHSPPGSDPPPFGVATFVPRVSVGDVSQWRQAVRSNADALRIFGIWKLVLTLVLASTPLVFYELPHFNKHARFFTRGIYPLFRPFFQWDGEHYMSLAINGYGGADASSGAFYPGLPFLVRAASIVVVNPIVAGLVVSTLLSLIFVVVYARQFGGDDQPRTRTAILLVLCHPMALCLAVVYSEALFLALLVGFLLARRHGHWAAYACAFAIPFSRGQGLMVAATFVGFAALMAALGRWRGEPLRQALGQSVAFVAGVAALFGTMAWVAGSPWSLFEAQQYFSFNNSIANIFDVEQTWAFITRKPDLIFDYLNSWFDKVFVVIAVVLLWPLAASRDWLRVCLGGALTIVPILMGEGGSFARFSFLPFVLVAPELARWLQPRPIVRTSVLTVGATLQLLVALRFAFNLWVS